MHDLKWAYPIEMAPDVKFQINAVLNKLKRHILPGVMNYIIRSIFSTLAGFNYAIMTVLI